MRACVDVNECLLRNGHGPCQGSCTNTWGSYLCSCDSVPGTTLAHDSRSCRDIDECNDPTFNMHCSHSCINTIGTAFCLCPIGYTLGNDWKTCLGKHNWIARPTIILVPHVLHMIIKNSRNKHLTCLHCSTFQL